MFVSQKPLVGRPHERVEEQERRTAAALDVEQVHHVPVFGEYGMSAVSRMPVGFDELTLSEKKFVIIVLRPVWLGVRNRVTPRTFREGVGDGFKR